MVTYEKEKGMIVVRGLKNPKESLERYSLPNPAYIQAKNNNRYYHNIPAKIYFAELRKDTLRVPLPCYRGDTGKIYVESKPFAAPTGLRDYQVTAVDDLLRGPYGCLQGGAGCGKTLMGTEASRRLGCRTLVVVPTKDILRQWQNTAKQFFDFEYHGFGGGCIEAKRDSWHVVATYQSVLKLPEMVANRGLIIIDEAHRSPCLTISKILAECPAPYRYGLTATPWRADDLHKSMDWLLGGVKVVIDRDMIDTHLIDPKIEIYSTPWQFPSNVDATAYQGLVAACGDRNEAIRKLVGIKLSVGHSVLVLAHRLEQLIALQKMGGVLIHGAMPKKERERALERVRDGSCSVLLATYNLAGEGLDIPRLSCLVYASPNGNKTRTEQSCGRIARPFEGKAAPVVVDLVDRDMRSKKYSKSRLRTYRSLNYRMEEMK